MKQKSRASFFNIDKRLIPTVKLAIFEICQGNNCSCEFLPPKDGAEGTISFEVEGEEDDLKRCGDESLRYIEHLKNFVRVVNTGMGCLMLPISLLSGLLR